MKQNTTNKEQNACENVFLDACGYFIGPFRGQFTLTMGCKWFNNFSQPFARGSPILFLAICQENYCLSASFANLLTFLAPSLLHRGEILIHNTLSEAFTNQLKMSLLTGSAHWDTDAAKLVSRSRLFSLFFCLLSRTVFEILRYKMSVHYYRLNQVESGCSLRPWSFHHSTVLMLCILWSELYLDINQLPNQAD